MPVGMCGVIGSTLFVWDNRGPLLLVIFILLVIFLDMFGENYPNFILRANPDAALSLARGVFEFFGHWLNINIIGDFF